MKANLFIVGAPKAGTTSLHFYLGQHHDVCMSSIKEPNFFSADAIQDLYYGTKPIRTAKEYEALFSRDAKVIGEASVSYLYYEKVPYRLKEYNRDARAIIVLRDPVERAISHYKMDCRLGFCSVTLKRILQEPSKYPEYYRQFVELGAYAAQVQRYIDVFGTENVLIKKYDDLKKAPSAFMDEIFSFLDLDPLQINADVKNQALIPRNAVVSRLYRNRHLRKAVRSLLPQGIQRQVRKRFLGGKEAACDEQVVTMLKRQYVADISRLSYLTGLDFSDWPSAT